MAMQHLVGKRKIIKRIVFIFAISLIPVSGAIAQDDKKSQPAPVTTENPEISVEELEHRLQPLTKDDLAVEADGWLQILKKHVGRVSDLQIKALKAEGEAKTELLESVTELRDQQTALSDRFWRPSERRVLLWVSHCREP
jgi:hypothetical protein